MTYAELFAIFSKPWASVKDIKSIASCGRDEATNIRNIISKEILDTGKNLPISKKKIVPMEYVIKYLGLDIEYVSEMARKENKIKS